MELLKALRDVHLIIGLVGGLNVDQNIQYCPHRAFYHLHTHMFLFSMSQFKEVGGSQLIEMRETPHNDAAQSSQ